MHQVPSWCWQHRCRFRLLDSAPTAEHAVRAVTKGRFRKEPALLLFVWRFVRLPLHSRSVHGTIRAVPIG